MRAVRLGLATVALLVVGLTSSASAAPNPATQAVSIASFAFSPPTVTINVGDSVKWTNLDAAVHSAVGQGGTFSTGNLTTNQSMTIAFNTAGTFAYVCGIHGASMSGTVIVRSAATAPPTAPPTAAPTAPPTVAPTARPTVAPTPQPTVAPTSEPTVTPTATIAPTAAPATTAPVAPASPSTTPATDSPRATATPAQDGPPVPLIVGGAAAIVIGLGALAWVLLRR